MHASRLQTEITGLDARLCLFRSIQGGQMFADSNLQAGNYNLAVTWQEWRAEQQVIARDLWEEGSFPRNPSVLELRSAPPPRVKAALHE